MVTAMGVHGYEPGHEHDPFWSVGGTPLDVAVFPAPLDKARREDLQAWSFLVALAASGAGSHPIELATGDDPPDRTVSFSSHRLGLELTELTIEDVRRDLARVRQLGRTVEQHLMDVDRFGHLKGRVVMLSAVRENSSALADSKTSAVLAALAEDLGCVGDGLELSDGLPEQLPSHGFYGEHGAVVVQVYRGEAPEAEPTVVATSQATFRRSEAIAALIDRIATKDRPGNDLLLITCGMVDERGHRCPADAFLFGALSEIVQAGQLRLQPPAHIRAVVLHEWQCGSWLELFSDGSARPWSSA